MQANRGIFESEGFRAHDFLTNRSGWSVKASRLTSNLKEGRGKWKKVITTLDRPVSTRINAPEQLVFDFSLENTFRSLADQWSEETEYISNINKAVKHPAYQQIIGMGKVAPKEIIPLILNELQRRPDHWFWALSEITRQDPSPPDTDFYGAVRAWIAWGRGQGHLT